MPDIAVRWLGAGEGFGEGAQPPPQEKIFLYKGSVVRVSGSSLKTGPAWPGHAKITLDITAVEFDQFSL